jgi:CRP-like cAMP-binding protein
MNNDFIEAFSRFKFLKINDLTSLFKYASLKTFKKGELIAKEGEYCDSVFFVLKGIIRTYVLAPEAEARTTNLLRKNSSLPVLLVSYMEKILQNT